MCSGHQGTCGDTSGFFLRMLVNTNIKCAGLQRNKLYPNAVIKIL
jgi:hypothetical protein